MIRVAWQGLLARGWRAVLSSLGIALGVAVLSGTLIVSQTADRAGITGPDIDLVRTIMAFTGGVALIVGAFVISQLGVRNLARHPQRTAATASAVLIGVALMSLVSVIMASTRAAIEPEYARSLYDFEVRAADGGPPLDPGAEVRLRAIPGLTTVVTQTCTAGGVDGDLVCAMDPARIGDVFALEMVAGRMSDVGEGGIAVSHMHAKASGLALGSPVTVTLPGGTRTLRVRAVYRSYFFLGAPLMAPAEYAALGGDPAPWAVYLRAIAGADPRQAIKAATGGQVSDRDAELRRLLEQSTNVTWVYRMLTGFATMIGLLGVVNILALSIVERRRELGMLRAIGMDRRQIRAMVRAEAIATGAVGAIAGLAIGALLGWAATAILTNSSVPIKFTLPVTVLGGIAALVILASVAASVLPARLASRGSPLRAIASE